MMLDCTIIIGGYLGAEIGPFIDDLYRKIDKLSVFTPYSKAYVYPCKYKREAKTIQHTIDGSCAPGLFPLVSIPTIIGCVGALLSLPPLPRRLPKRSVRVKYGSMSCPAARC